MSHPHHCRGQLLLQSATFALLAFLCFQAQGALLNGCQEAQAEDTVIKGMQKGSRKVLACASAQDSVNSTLPACQLGIEVRRILETILCALCLELVEEYLSRDVVALLLQALQKDCWYQTIIKSIMTLLIVLQFDSIGKGEAPFLMAVDREVTIEGIGFRVFLALRFVYAGARRSEALLYLKSLVSRHTEKGDHKNLSTQAHIHFFPTHVPSCGVKKTLASILVQTMQSRNSHPPKLAKLLSKWQ